MAGGCSAANWRRRACGTSLWDAPVWVLHAANWRRQACKTHCCRCSSAASAAWVPPLIGPPTLWHGLSCGDRFVCNFFNPEKLFSMGFSKNRLASARAPHPKCPPHFDLVACAGSPAQARPTPPEVAGPRAQAARVGGVLGRTWAAGGARGRGGRGQTREKSSLAAADLGHQRPHGDMRWRIRKPSLRRIGQYSFRGHRATGWREIAGGVSLGQARTLGQARRGTRGSAKTPTHTRETQEKKEEAVHTVQAR